MLQVKGFYITDETGKERHQTGGTISKGQRYGQVLLFHLCALDMTGLSKLTHCV